MSNYHYLDLTLELPKGLKREIPAVFFKKHVMQALNALFGEVGASTTVDLLKYESIPHRAVLRVPSVYYVKLRSSLTLAGDYEGIPCAYRIHKSSTYLLNLLGDSRNYNHE
ncbi:ribonuclease P protein subunit p14 [Chrysoperla carnea]|uniref:ribonuclease P protein subunit p14 n=1 Tax=Chrysoperla carnea TaxID=189513 RepID=UPI001D06A397|nr:ribonuclease P protein subunit p14 [Chrysoperla carnea]